MLIILHQRRIQLNGHNYVLVSRNCDFSVLYFNACTLLPKIDYFHVAWAVHSPDIICNVETWLNSNILNSELCIKGYEIVHNRHYGGVLIHG